ncbi:aromatic prenyltransferase [Triangularia verruculosa]|uniref:Aromatic prenyltransferase n=1 Tax=Triangularia verruculosa TaxID=2587418 RepID=A0AAN7AW34_9PEZI|nr:aromatic prenyltransferase [Triangularia verruculosa]
MAIFHSSGLADEADFDSLDQRFWWQATGPSLSRLLALSGYTDKDQQSHIHWYHQFITAALGPRPIAGTKLLFQPCPVFDGSACELSINFKERSPERTVRFTIEATGHEAGTNADPFNQDESTRLLQSMVGNVGGLDLHQFNIFAEKLFFSPEDAAALLPHVPQGTPLSQVWLAFDLLRGGDIMAKVYFMPILKWIETGIPTKDLVFDAARRCDKHGSYERPIQLLDDFLCEGVAPPVVEMVAIDCINSLDARIKVYLRTDANTLGKARHLLTLGGRLSGELVEQGLEALSELWPVLFCLPEGTDIDNIEVFPAGSYCGCAVEMKPDREEPETKLHIPVRKIQGTDAQLCESLSKWFKQRGHTEFSAKYKENLENVFPHHDLERTGGTHTFVSFSYTKRAGVYMTMYYSTKIFVTSLKVDIWEGYDNFWRQRKH